ncbi:ABC transporter substrate-binding protein [Paenibacillus monticola]|uniref:Extracellular solute-binding protein n=1 Tax=Paenibacillus monticola TaxID=2666075 RepID=A0A7X2H132_9BACL|nr:extracellular solute-binding protein [Paenibacillus monticola]MRN51614.1 extracellular solute-binding protein [Paenibacillus monticola]
MKKPLSLALALLISISMLSACGSNKSSDSSTNGETTKSGEKVKVEFFQYKSEAVATYDKLIAKFETANPGIDVVQTNVPEAATVLKTRIAKGDVPDIISVGGDAQFEDLATNGVLADLTDYPGQANVIENYKKTLQAITGTEELYGVPFAANADGIIYNKDEFTALGLKVPTTKDEMDKVLETIKTAGKVPFYFAFKDAWTAVPAWNVFVADLQPASFFTDRKAGTTTFATAHKDLMNQYIEFMQNGQSGDRFTNGYNDGNAEFAKGSSVMYLQGVWAIPEILKANPDIKLGVFAYPLSNDTSKNYLVSGVDVLFSLSATSKVTAEATKFIDFMMEADNAQQYIDEQKSFSTINNIFQNDEVYSDLKPIFAEGRVADFPDHYINGMAVDVILQELMQKKNVDNALAEMDTQYDKMASR